MEEKLKNAPDGQEQEIRKWRERFYCAFGYSFGVSITILYLLFK